MNETLLTIIFVLIVTVFFSVYALKQKQSSWAGELVKKKIDDGDDTTQTTYKLIFKTDRGKKKVTFYTKNEFDRWQIGDKAIKKSGSYFPEKTPSK